MRQEEWPKEADDRIYPGDGWLEIPMLLSEPQPCSGLLLPFAGWGVTPRARRKVGTYHFYVDDYRFSNVWQRPERIIASGCREAVEPNFSLYQTTPVAYGLQLLYKKRWIARWLQEQGVGIWVDLNVAPKFRELNKLGVPEGYNAFATRGYEGELCQLEAELAVAREISGKEAPNMIVYGGGEQCKSYCRQNGLLYLDPYQVDRRTQGKESSHG